MKKLSFGFGILLWKFVFSLFSFRLEYKGMKKGIEIPYHKDESYRQINASSQINQKL